jgi:hypothetical protein
MDKADAKGHKPLHGCSQFCVGVRDLKRNHQQRYREGENGICETFQPSDLSTAPAEVLFRRHQCGAHKISYHRPLFWHISGGLGLY